MAVTEYKQDTEKPIQAFLYQQEVDMCCLVVSKMSNTGDVSRHDISWDRTYAVNKGHPVCSRGQ